MRYSYNYNLKLPQRGVDRANVDDLDDNFGIIDGALADDRQISLLMYDSTQSYNTGDIRGYENPTTHRIRAFRCLEDNVTGSWDATKWAQTTLADEIGTGGGASSLADLTDTDITSPTNGQTLKYNSTSGKWENTSGGAVSDLDDLGDVDITTPSDGDLLTYDAQNDEWVNAPASVPDLGDLGDVTLTTPIEGQILEFDGDEWVNTDAPDVDVTKTATGNPIEISDGANAPLVKCVTQITGYQEGSGTPSPDNIRPIVAYTEGKIEVSDGDGNTTTHTTTYPSAIYRGSEDVVNGEVTADWIKGKLSDFTFTKGQRNSANTGTIFYVQVSNTKKNSNIICSCMETINDVTPWESMDVGTCFLSTPSVGNPYLVICLDYQDVASMISDVGNEDIAYKLATPQTSSVTPTNLPIKSLSSYSHIESSTGEMEIEYIAKAFSPITELVDSQISALQKMMELMLTSARETTMTASANYTTGTLIVACGALYKATTAISSGASLVVGTNISETTIAAELAALQ